MEELVTSDRERLYVSLVQYSSGSVVQASVRSDWPQWGWITFSRNLFSPNADKYIRTVGNRTHRMTLTAILRLFVGHKRTDITIPSALVTEALRDRLDQRVETRDSAAVTSGRG